MASTNLFTRFPQWLRLWFRLQEPQIPKELIVDAVIPVVDTVQGGWGYVGRAEPGVAPGWSPNATNIAASTGAAQYTVLARIPDSFYLVTGVSLVRSGGAGNIFYRLLLRHPDSVDIDLWGANVTPSSIISWSTIGAGAPYWIIPPQCQLILADPTGTGVGETVALNLVKLHVPEGVKPI